MVRLKTRYMLVRLELADINKGKAGASKEPGRIKEFPTRKEMARATQDSIATCFGTSAGDAFMEIQGEQNVACSATHEYSLETL